jgi:hypothetical protein
MKKPKQPLPKKAARAAPSKRKDKPSARPGPPEKAKFKPGQSGNPEGRPKGSKNLATLIKEAAKHTVEATINGKKRKITTVQSALFQLASAAARGDPRAIPQFLDYVDDFEQRAEASRPTQFPFSAADLEVLKAIYERMKLCSPDPT